MFTPQQLEQVTFHTSVFGGYDMDSVDEFLVALIEDYNTLYKDNATLKSKMRILVEKLEEYRAGEGSAKESLRAVQQTCDNMVREAEAKCLKMLHQAEAQAPSTSLADAKAVAREGIESLETQLKEVLDKLETIKSQAGAESRQEAPKPQNEAQVAQEIAQNLEKLVGTTEDTAPVPRSPRVDSNTTSRFTNLQFGKNYDPTKR